MTTEDQPNAALDPTREAVDVLAEQIVSCRTLDKALPYSSLAPIQLAVVYLTALKDAGYRIVPTAVPADHSLVEKTLQMLDLFKTILDRIDFTYGDFMAINKEPIETELAELREAIFTHLAVPADQRQRTIDSLNTSIETWAESTGRRDDPVKSKGGMFFDPAEPTFGEYAWNRLTAVPADHVTVSREDLEWAVVAMDEDFGAFVLDEDRWQCQEARERLRAALAADQTDVS